jgi:hypothetical protein
MNDRIPGETFAGYVVESAEQLEQGRLRDEFEAQHTRYMEREFNDFIARIRLHDSERYDQLPKRIHDDFREFMSQYSIGFIADDIESFVEIYGVDTLVLFPLVMHCGNDYLYQFLDIHSIVSMMNETMDPAESQHVLTDMLSWLSEVVIMLESVEFSSDEAYRLAKNRLYKRVQKLLDALFVEIDSAPKENAYANIEHELAGADHDAIIKQIAGEYVQNMIRLRSRIESVSKLLIESIVPATLVDIARLACDQVDELPNIRYESCESGGAEYISLRSGIADLVQQNWGKESPRVCAIHMSTLESDMAHTGARYYVLRGAVESEVVASMRFEDTGEYIYTPLCSIYLLHTHICALPKR